MTTRSLLMQQERDVIPAVVGPLVMLTCSGSLLLMDSWLKEDVPMRLDTIASSRPYINERSNTEFWSGSYAG